MTKVSSVRFSKDESPSHINNGKGWTPEKATEWLLDHDLHANDLTFDSGYIRAKQFEPGNHLGGDEPAIGVIVNKAEKRAD